MKSNWNEKDIEDLTCKTVIITGATSGIGKEAAKIMASKNAEVIMGVRNLQKAQDVIEQIKKEFPNANVKAYKLDNMSLKSVDEFVNTIKENYSKIDVLINNAGIMMVDFERTEDGFESQMATNHFAHFKLTGKLLPLLEKSDDPRIVVVSSGAQNFGKLNMLEDINFENSKYAKTRAYGNSKLANMLFVYELAKKLEKNNSNVKAIAVHPGWTDTPLQNDTWLKPFNRFFAIKPEIGCLPTLRGAFGKDVQSGEYYGPETKGIKQGYPIKQEGSKNAYNSEAAAKLWDISQNLTNTIY